MPVLGADDLWEVRVKQTYLGQKISNVFWYRGDPALNGTAAGVAADFDTACTALWRAAVNASLIFNSIEVINHNDVADFHERSLSDVVGTFAGDPEPSFLALRVRMVRETRETRNGDKRYAGLVEGGLSGNTVAQATIDAFNPFIGQTHVTFSGVYVPVIVSKQFTGDPPVLLNPTLWVTNGITDAEIVGLTTQNSRKPGVGD